MGWGEKKDGSKSKSRRWEQNTFPYDHYVVRILSDGEELLEARIFLSTEQALLLKKFGEHCSLQISREITTQEPL